MDVTADPPPIADLPPESAPSIRHGDAQPTASEPLMALVPFEVPVQVDPNTTIQWRVFIDLVRTSPMQNFLEEGTLYTGPGFTTPVSFSLPDLGAECHTITLIVASHNGFDSNMLFVPLPPGGDEVTWFFEPVGDCGAFEQ